MRPIVVACALLIGCKHADTTSDGETDATIPLAQGWAEPIMVTLDRPAGAYATDPSLSEDQARVFYAVTAIGSTDYDLYEAPMTSPTMGGSRRLVLARPGVVEASPEISPDGLEMYFLAFSGSAGVIDRITRASLTRQWSAPAAPTELNAAMDVRPGNVDRAKQHIVIVRGLALAELSNESGMWVDQSTTASLPAGARDPQLSPDGLTLAFTGNDGANGTDLFVTVRPAIGMAWSLPYRMSVSDPDMPETDPWLAADGKRLYFTRGATIYVSERQ